MSTKSSLKTQWDLSPLFSDIKDPNIQSHLDEVKKNIEKFANKWKKRTDYLENPKILRESLDEYEALIRNYYNAGKAAYYADLVSSLDQNDPEIKALVNKVIDHANKNDNEILFYPLSISKIPESKQKEFLESEELLPYKHYLERLFANSKYLLSEKEEKILNLISNVSFSKWVDMTSSFLAKEEREVLTNKGKKKMSFSKILGYTSNKTKKVRESAAQAFNEILEKHIDVGEQELNAVLAYKKIIDELKGYDRPDKSRHISDDIDTETVDALIKAVSSKYSISKKYYRLKAKLFGVEKLQYYERNVEYGNIKTKFSYEKSFDLVKKVLTSLDKEFGNILQMYNDNGQIDVYPKKGKKSGAFCAHNLMSQPTYILLNHNDRLDDVLTLAHELGHGINNELIKKSQHALYFDTPVSTAEVASTFIEDFVFQELMNKANEEEKLALMMSKLNNDISTIFRQVACYKLEQDLHYEFRKEGYLSKEKIGKIFLDNMKAYTGDAISYKKGSENWWLYWSHLRYFFYVYSYASGLLISKSLQKMVKNDPENIIKVKKFLSAGTSKKPFEIFMDMGININDENFWYEGISEVETLLEETEKLARKLGKI